MIFLLGDGVGTQEITAARYYQEGTAPAAVAPSQRHTGAVVPVWASGPGGLAVLGSNDHTDLFDVLGQ